METTRYYVDLTVGSGQEHDAAGRINGAAKTGQPMTADTEGCEKVG